MSSKTSTNTLPTGVVERLSAYLNCLMQFRERGYRYISSKEIGMCTNINPAEVRRDLVKFGSFGKKGMGYPVDELIREIQKILGSRVAKRVALVGAGNLGTAIANFDGLKKHGFKIEAIFDIDPEKVGKKLGDAHVYHSRDLEDIIRELDIKIAIIATPGDAAQEVADRLVKSGVKIIINYSDRLITVPPTLRVHNSNPVIELLHTLYYYSHIDVDQT